MEAIKMTERIAGGHGSHPHTSDTPERLIHV